MATTQDCSVGIAKETTYKTYATPTRFFEFTEESLGWEKNVVQGQGLRVGGRVARSGRRVVPTAAGAGDLTIEATSKGMGLLLEGCFGTGTSTQIGTSSVYQQLFTLADTLPSFTLEKGIPRVDGTVDPYTFLGAMVSSFQVDCPNGELVTIQTSWDVGDISVAQTYSSPSYASSPTLFHFAGASIYSGTLTAPTTSSLASANSELASVRSFSLSVNNNIAADRYNFGGGGRKDKPTVGLREIAGSVEIEYANTTFRDAVLDEDPLVLVITLEAAALSSGNETLQLVLPEVKFDNALVNANGGDIPMQSLNFAVLDNLTAAQPIWAVTRTADTAL